MKHQYGPNSAGNFLAYVTDAAGGTLNAVYSTDATYSRLTAIQDTKGREIRYGYDARGNLTSITYPDGSKSQFTYDGSHKLLSVTNQDGYRVNYEYTNDFRVPRVSKVSETGQKNAPGQELKISYENGNTTILKNLDWMVRWNIREIIRKQRGILTIWDVRQMCWMQMDLQIIILTIHPA